MLLFTYLGHFHSAVSIYTYLFVTQTACLSLTNVNLSTCGIFNDICVQTQLAHTHTHRTLPVSLSKSTQVCYSGVDLRPRFFSHTATKACMRDGKDVEVGRMEEGTISRDMLEKHGTLD